MRRSLALALLLLGACRTSPCLHVYSDLCDVCPKNDYNKALCKCLQEGTLTKDDAGDSFHFETNDDAQQWCDQQTFGLTYTGDDLGGQCKADQAYLNQWGADACEDLNFPAP